MSSLEDQAAERKIRLTALRNKSKSDISADKPKDPTIKSRNYDPTTQSTVLGLSRPPTTLDENSETVEAVSQAVSDELLAKFRAQADVSVKEAIKPRKATWDLERDLADDLRLLREKTDEVVHSIVKERIHKLKSQDS